MKFVQPRLNSRLHVSVAVFFCAFLYAVASIDAHAAVPFYRPTDDAHIVLRLTSDRTERQLAQLRQATRRSPQDIDALARYTNALILAGKHSGNERYYGYAEQALNTASTETQRALAITKAQLLQQRHEFRGAEQVLNELLIREPRHRDARLMRAQLRLHLHEPTNALRDCATLMPLVDLLTSTTCFAQARAALGDVSRAYALVTALLPAPHLPTSSAPDATHSYSAGVAAELAARLGHNDAATNWYRLAYELDRESHFPRIAYADWLLSQGQYREALSVARTGASPADKLRVVIAEQNAHSLAAQQLQLSWTEAAANGERNHLRDQARFEFTVLHDAARAHATALDNFRDHREAEDALLLAATAASVRDKSALATVQAWRAERKYQDTRIASLVDRT